MTKAPPPPLYKQHFIDKGDERIPLFRKLKELYQPRKGLYPGSFLHITPSFFIPDMTYVDMDRRFPGFFNNPEVMSFISRHKDYARSPEITAIHKDYTKDLGLENTSFDILFSFYAGFVSRYCSQYLRPGGYLVTNDSHGDASLAFLNPEYTLSAVVKRNGNRFSISEKNLPDYFQKKNGQAIDKEKILAKMRGGGYAQTAWAYIFRKIAN